VTGQPGSGGTVATPAPVVSTVSEPGDEKAASGTAAAVAAAAVTTEPAGPRFPRRLMTKQATVPVQRDRAISCQDRLCPTA
jgi:hypothetical protein